MVVDVDRCSGCQACVIACQAENNIPVNTDERFRQRRPTEWIRIERYWELPRKQIKGGEQIDTEGLETEFATVKARFIPVFCQHCDNAPCEPVCPVYATYHNPEGLNVQVYNRCIGTRLCQNNDPYNVRFFNWFEPKWPETLKNHLNPDVSIRSRGVMEKCSFCVQRIRRAERTARKEGREVADGEFAPACVQACPTDALVFGDANNAQSRVSKLKQDSRHYRLLEHTGAEPNAIYLKKVDPHFAGEEQHG
jgi:molybdopterin-containing oxidoreductase family iron-sulfur binding subunit